jgi:hypothetical protein
LPFGSGGTQPQDAGLPLLARDKKSGVDLASLKPLNALGISATGGAEPTIRIRLSFK